MANDAPITIFDPRRLLVGKAPWGFLLEVAARGLFVYVILLFAIRLMGKRVAGQLSLSELAVIVTLGAAIGVPLEVPEHGLLPAVVLLGVAVGYQRAIGILSFKRRNIELLTQGDLVVLVLDGIIELGAMRRTGLSRERLFVALREQALVHLGQVSRVYIEVSGAFSVYRRTPAQPGLRIVPSNHPGVRAAPPLTACVSCGTVRDRPSPQNAPCPTCDGRQWDGAVLSE
jgi:uncharacterized membrane protein YcaP (DUF421 family)